MDCDSFIRKHDEILAPGSPEKLDKNLRKLKGRLHPDKNQGRDDEFKQLDQCESAIRRHYSRPSSARPQAALAASPVRPSRADMEELRRREEQIRAQVERERAERERVRRDSERRQQAEREAERRRQEFARQEEERLRQVRREREEQQLFERERHQRERREAEIRAAAIARREAETRARIMRGQYTAEERQERMLRRQNIAESLRRSRSPVRAPVRSQSPIRLGEFPGVMRPVSPVRERSPPRIGMMSRLRSYLWPEDDIVWESRVGPMPYNSPAGWIDAQGREHRYRM